MMYVLYGVLVILFRMQEAEGMMSGDSSLRFRDEWMEDR